MKITGAEWKDFESTGWPEGYIWSDESTLDDGREFYDGEGIPIIGDADTFVIPSFWSVMLEDDSLMKQDSGKTIRSLVREWRKKRDGVTLAVTVSKEAEARFREIAAAEGWKVA